MRALIPTAELPAHVHYERAPIVEAVIDIHVAFATEPSVRDLEAQAKVMRGRFPQQQRINAFSVALNSNVDDSVGSNTSSSALGVRLSSAAGDRIVQLRRQGISLSHAHPYSRWETFIEDFRPLWAEYCTTFGPTTITRFAVRYINRIVLPRNIELEKYVTVTPRLPAGPVSEHVEGYFVQMVLAQRDIDEGCKAVINSGLEPGPSKENMAVLLDIDVFIENQAIPISTADVWGTLARLRDRKNQMFEASITDEVRKLIK